MNKRADTRDNFVHYALRNWARYINSGWQDGPRRTPLGASWHEQVTERVIPTDTTPPVYIDCDSGKRTQAAMVLFMVRDIDRASVLIKHYRDNWTVTGLRTARNKFWRYL